MDQLAAISQHLLQFSPDALIVVDVDGKILFANATTRALFGYARSQLIGQPIDMLVPDRYHLRHGAHVSGFLRGPTNREMGARIIDLFARRSDGSEFPAGIRLAPFYDGDQTFVAAAIRDMSERRAVNDALVAAREEADRANAAKTRFLATASHDLRQPLQTIRLLNASLLTLAETRPDLHDLLQRQEAAIDGASRLLNALLDITRLESNAIQPHLEPVSLAAVYQDLSREFEAVAVLKGVKLQFTNTTLGLLTDRMLFHQLLQNLIGNALKYTSSGRVEIHPLRESDALLLCIDDTGVGIPQDKLERIFDEYYQVDTAGVQRSGMGLGLAIVREVARLLGYSVTVASELGIGTHIKLRIPAQHILDESADRAAPQQPAAKAHASSQCRIILVEDNDSVRDATELFLTLEGYETLCAGSVTEADHMLAGLLPGDILVSDYHLDGQLTGLDILQQLRKRHGRNVPAVLLSGDLQSMMRVMKTALPNCRFLSKPVDANSLLEAIAELAAA